ncbi:hypothetical protein QSJ19_04440 [Gordonia sp. ABSL11-1]|uniref:hypothetical protein n=1 Tax=Gordonia sp. ABSL11-1 TaxID=3053924 RepID=UPI002572EE50|nr:hypothetical protein [Gordonia sp. ABSL11-1]MDL9944843.1 hypothetical protein [Gordonia sp. ABSL11-1]
MPDRAVLDDERTARRDLRRAADDLLTAEVAAGVRRRSRAVSVLVVLAVAAVLAATVCVVYWFRATGAYTDDDYERAATARVSVLLSPDHRRPDQVRRILDGATGEFHDQFAQSADGYTKFVDTQGTVGQGTVDGVGVSARSGDKATVLVAATVLFTSEKPGAEGSGAEGSGAEGSGAEGSGAERSGTERSGTERSGTEGSGAEGQSARQFRLRVLLEPDDGQLKIGAVQYLP